MSAPKDVVRGCDRRDYDAEAAASERYETLRTFSMQELEEAAGWRGPRQQMIATIMTQDDGRGASGRADPETTPRRSNTLREQGP